MDIKSALIKILQNHYLGKQHLNVLIKLIWAKIV